MDDATARALGHAWRSDRPWDVLTRLTELENRFPGYPSERKAASVVSTALEEAGVEDLHDEPFDMNRWMRGEADLVVSVPDRDLSRTFDAVALPYCPAYDGTAPLIDVGYGTPEELAETDVSGAIALTSTASPPELGRTYHRVEKIGQAAAAGAEGFVFINHVPGRLPPTGTLTFGSEAAIPGVGVSKETGGWLREYAEETARARLRVEARTESGQGHNVVGVIGPDTDEEVLVLAHYDAHDISEGALDNGCGVATVVGMAEILAELDLDLDRRIRIAMVSGEELGLLGSEALVDGLDVGPIHAVVNVDGAGRFHDLKALTHTSDALAETVDRVAEDVGYPITTEDRPHPYSDHWPFLRNGIPALQLHSEDPDVASQWERGWTHTGADTRDKADPRIIREHAMLAALLVRTVAGTSLPRVDGTTVRDQLVTQGADEGMRAAGIWPEEWE